MRNCKKILVGLTERHGKAMEEAQSPPDGIQYQFLSACPSGFSMIRSPIKNYLQKYDDSAIDIMESVISPVVTSKPWIHSCANLQETVAFNILGVPVPRAIRLAWIERMFARESCAKVIFWSHAGLRSLEEYGQITNPRVQKKSTVVYPAVRKAPIDLIRYSGQSSAPVILFSGEFFRKGGMHVVDAFEQIQTQYNDARLWLCCDEQIDFRIGDLSLRERYLAKIKANEAIQFGRVPRERLLNDILPETDVYLLPTYEDTFGFALLEAMTFGVPVISTAHFAIPEIVEHEVTGFLIDFKPFDSSDVCKGYTIDSIPSDFHEYMSSKVVTYLQRLLDSPELRYEMGQQAIRRADQKFSFKHRNSVMKQIYESIAI